ncbi:hypothetical protein PVK06_001322 [Gossypium arboreum]|uniref:Uncharacterized protein n=1 Tax=Gossypium arboreum TaxID=29729 RepID=A0ABR0R213_GOSAR|nr:hypothetical protein PVK06_001322 [Gossypium arboreum]
MARRPQMDMSFYLQASLEYIQWYSSMGKPYLLGGQSTAVPPHVQRPEAYGPVVNIEPEPQQKADPERSYSHLADTSYHPDLLGNDYFSGSSGGGYRYGFDIFRSYPLQYSTNLGPYPPQYSTPLRLYPPQHDIPPGSSSSMPFDPYDFSSMYQTPSPATEEDVGHHNYPQRERQPPQKYTPGPLHRSVNFRGFLD